MMTVAILTRYHATIPFFSEYRSMSSMLPFDLTNIEIIAAMAATTYMVHTMYAHASITPLQSLVHKAFVVGVNCLGVTVSL